MPDAVAVLAAVGLAGLLEASAFNIVKPAVVEAAEPAVFDPAVAQVGAAVRAMQAQQTRPTLIVAEQRQLLAQNFHRRRRAALGQFFDERDRLPVASDHLAGRRAFGGAGQ